MRVMRVDGSRRTRRWGAVLAGALAAALSASARADGLSAQANGGYSGSRTITTDETGHEREVDTSVYTQRYRLTLDHTFWPNLSLSTGGFLDWTIAPVREEGVKQEIESRRWSGFAHLRAGTPLLSGSLDYDHQRQESSISGTAIPSLSSAVLRDTYGGSISWRPAELPSLDLRLTRSETHDRARSTTDLTSDDALLSTRFEPTKDVLLRYAVRAAAVTDHVNDVRSTQLANSAAATWTGAYLSGRGTAYASYTVSALNSTVSARGAGGTVSTLQLPVGGLSVVEVFPALPTRVTLNPNSALVDGVTGASAGLNLGYSATSPTGERPLRDLGAQFANTDTPVNAVYVYVDRTLPEELAQSFLWTAYESEDNLDWTLVGGAVTARFDPLQNRFEIPIERTTARFLKVVVRPLPRNVSTSQQFSEIFVTELQFYLVVEAEQAAGKTSTVGGNLNATTRIQLLDSGALTYDVSTLLTHTSSGQRVTYAITNGLSASRRLSRVFGTNGRIERTDADAGSGHEATNRWSGTLSFDPLVTFGGALVYSGQLSQQRGGNVLTQSLALAARADLYEGIAANGNVAYALAHDERGRDTRSTSMTAGATLTPNRVLSLAGSVGFTDASQTGGGEPARSDQRGTLEASASFTPFRSLAMSGTVTRLFGRSIPPQTLASVSAGFSPFQGGDLSVRYSFQETIDTSGRERTRSHGPGARWNIRRGWFLDGGVTFLEARAPAQDVDSQFYFANLTVALR